MKAYKMVKDDYTDFYSGTVKYTVGETLIHPNPDLSLNPCGEGYHVSREPHNPLSYNARFPWRLLEVNIKKKDIIFDDGDKIRVKKLKVIKELKPWDIGIPNSKRVYDLISRASKIKLRQRTKKAEKDIRILVKWHVLC